MMVLFITNYVVNSVPPTY